jgi:DNA-binding transcriptional LysR family regulator
VRLISRTYDKNFAPALPGFWARYPRLTIEFLVANRLVNLIAENVDISLRTGRQPDSATVACKIIDLSQMVCASPDYLANHGHPLTPFDLTSMLARFPLTSASTPAPTGPRTSTPNRSF